MEATIENKTENIGEEQKNLCKKIFWIITSYRKYGLQYVPKKLRGGIVLTSNDGREAIFTCSAATKNGHQSDTKFLVWIHWQDTGKIVKTTEFKLFI